MVDIRRFISTRLPASVPGQSPASVSGSEGGPTIGAPSAAQNPAWAGGTGFFERGVTPDVPSPDGASVRPIPAHRPPAVILPDIFDGNGPSPISLTAAGLWFDSNRPATDYPVLVRKTRIAVDSYASRVAWGSSDVASGPEGTLVLMPPRLPRQLATRRSIAGAHAGNVLLNYANGQTQTPDTPVVVR